jgi:hypothetical protein
VVYVPDSTVEEVREMLHELKETVEDGGEVLDLETREFEVDNGRLILEPKVDNFVHLHYVDADGDAHFEGSGRINRVLTHDIGFPMSGKFEPFTAFYSNGREMFKLNFDYFSDE